MPTRLCAEPGCPNTATTRGRCHAHARTNNRQTHSNTAHRAIYNSKRWQQLRRRVLFEQPICCGCDNALSVDVDHIRSLDTGGKPYERANVQGLCVPCHSEKTRREQRGDITRPAFIVLCGKPGVGKTTVREHLAHLTCSAAFGPDDYGNWTDVLDRLDRTDHAVIECCRLPRALRRKIAERSATIVELTAPLDDRRQRLLGRGDNPRVVERLLSEDDLGLGYEEHLEPHIVVSTAEHGPADTARSIAARIDPKALSTNPMG